MLSKIKALASKVKEPTDQQGSHLVALDIGTEYVKALLVHVDGDEATIVGVGREHQQLADMQAGAIADISAVVANCEAALTEAEKDSGISARSAVIGIAGELVKGTTTTVAVRRKDASQPITNEELDRIIKLVQDRAATKAKEQLRVELGGKEVEVKLVNSALVDILIDSYKITNPIGFQGSLVTVQLYNAFAPLVHIGAIERAAEQLDLELLAIAAEPFAVSRSVIGNDPNSALSAILIDIGGGTTDIAVVHEGGVEGTKMFGIGGRAFTKAIERELGVDYNTAEKYKLALGTLHANPKHAVEIEKALKRTLDVWLAGIELALAEFKQLDNLPHRILLCGGGASLNLLREALEQRSWYTNLPFTRKPTIQLIDPDQVVGIKDETEIINDHTYITALGLVRVGLDTVGDVSSKTGLRDRINKILAK